jgi:Putative Ig domain
MAQATATGGLTATDYGSLSCTPPVTATCVSITAVQGVPITPVTMMDSGGVGGSYTFSATGLPAGLTMSSSGTISGTPTVSGTFPYTVTVKDANGNTGTVNCSVTVAPPVSANCVSITAVQGVMITPVTMVGSGGVGGPYTFSATGLLSGLTMSSSGTISGTPTESGTFSYTVTVKDSAGNAGTVNCSVTVCSPPTATCVSITAVQGVAITPVTITGSGGVGGPYTFSVTGLPSGLSISTSGTISGTPTVTGTFSYTVTVKDSAGNTGTVNCSVTINSPPTASCVSITAIQGVAITPVTMTGSGGAGGPYTFSATGLPPGLSMSSTGTISGKPTSSGTYSYTVTNGDTGTVNCSVTVSSPPTATCVSITAIQGVAITPVTMTGSGGAGGPYTFSATGLPSGLTMSSTGTISGTPTVSGTFSYTVTVTDKNGNTGTVNCSATVAPPPCSAGCVTITNAVQGVAITPVTLTGTGGAGDPYSFTASGLPAGLTISSTGTISGTPTVSGTFNYMVTIKDKNGNNAGTINCSVTIAPPTCGAGCATITAFKNVAMTPVTLTGTGGAGGPYSFTASGLLSGLSISSSGTISGTPTVNRHIQLHCHDQR